MTLLMELLSLHMLLEKDRRKQEKYILLFKVGFIC